MALATDPTLTPTGTLTFACPPPVQTDPTGVALVPAYGVANTVPIPAGTGTPATALITNIGPDPAFVTLGAAAATTTGTATSGSTALTVASGTGILAGQQVLGAGIAPGTFVLAVSGTAVTLSKKTINALSTTAVNFVVPVTTQTGVAIGPNESTALAYVASGFVSAITPTGQGLSVLNVAVGT